MKKQIQKSFTSLIFITLFATGFAQTWTVTSAVNGIDNVSDIVAKGNTLFAAAGVGGVYKSVDGGQTWTKTSNFPDVGFGTEGANYIIIAANGDLVVSGNQYYGGAQVGGTVFRSADDGQNWTYNAVSGMAGYEEAGTIVELPNGTLTMKGGTSNIYSLFPDSSNWTKMTDPGGAITMLANYAETLFVTTNLKGLQYSINEGTSWNYYGTNGTILSDPSPQQCRMLITANHKFIGFGGSGPFRAGKNDTLWISKKAGLPDPVYTSALSTDGNKIWIAFQQAGSGNTCYSGVSSDNGDSWTTYPGNSPVNPTLPVCLRKIVPMGNDIFSFAGKDVYKIANVAQSAGSMQEEKEEVHVFPNPSENIFTVNYSGTSGSVLTLRIMDVLGNVVYSESLGSAMSKTLELKNLSPGIYILSVNSKDKISSTKLIID